MVVDGGGGSREEQDKRVVRVHEKSRGKERRESLGSGLAPLFFFLAQME